MEIESTIDIAALPSKVWSILADVENWSEWSPTIHAASGTPVMGSKLDITMVGKDGAAGPRYEPVMMEFTEPSLFSWRAKMMAGFVMTNEKIITLEEIPSGTRLTHTETFRGIMAVMSKKHMQEGVPPMLTQMNDALKEQAEK